MKEIAMCCVWERRRLAGKLMREDLPARRRRSQAFTLIELLVVIAIIAILASITLVVVAKVHEQGRITEAKRQIHALRLAIQEYHSDTDNYPVSDPVLSLAITARSDFTLGGSSLAGIAGMPPMFSTNNSDVMAILLDRQKDSSGAATANLNHARNKKQKVYLSDIPSADTTNLPGLGPDLVYRDPWGNPYIITFDLNFDENSRDALYAKSTVSKDVPGSGYDDGLNSVDPSGNKDDFQHRGGVMIWSLGPDKKADPTRRTREAPNKDNIVSWR